MVDLDKIKTTFAFIDDWEECTACALAKSKQKKTKKLTQKKITKLRKIRTQIKLLKIKI